MEDLDIRHSNFRTVFGVLSRGLDSGQIDGEGKEQGSESAHIYFQSKSGCKRSLIGFNTIPFSRFFLIHRRKTETFRHLICHPFKDSGQAGRLLGINSFF